MFKSCTVNSKDYSKPNRSDNQHPHPTQDASLRTNGGPSRLYQASRGSHSATRTTEIQKTDGDRSGSPVSNADPERSDSIIQSRADVSRIIDMFDRQSASSSSSSSSTLAGRRHPNSSRITGTGQRSIIIDVAPSSSIVKSRIDAKDANSAIVFAADSDPPVPGSSVDRWKGTGGPGGPGDDDEDRQSLVESASDASVATSSGYSTDLSTDHAVSLLPQRLLLHSNGEPAETEEDQVDQEDHPYFARLAAEAEGPTPILGRSGSFRGFKNLVRAGIASILDKTDGKKSVNYGLSERGKVVFYTTSVTVVRDTFDKCYSVKRILQTQMVEFEEKDVFLSKSTQQELIDRLHPIDADLPQVFVDGHHLGGAEEIERLNEDGTLRRIFSNFKKVQQSTCCVQCGGYRFVPCSLCNGSKKARRNRFTDEFCALRCTKCDDNGLVRCNTCNNAAVDDGDPRDD